MTCEECWKAGNEPADANGNTPPHPENCGCTCQHYPRGAWKGGKTE